MNENYLWDKTGNDPEIEKLENALQAFRHTATAAPVLPTKVLPLTIKKRRSFFRPGFAAAACVMLLITGLGLWISTSDKSLKGEITSAKVIAMPTRAPLTQESTVSAPADPVMTKTNGLPVTAVKFTPPATKQNSFKTRKSFPAVHVKAAPVVNNSAPYESVAQLTGEEKYAYDQLMLALSITSSKLKIVKDKVDGLEKPNPVLSNGN